MKEVLSIISRYMIIETAHGILILIVFRATKAQPSLWKCADLTVPLLVAYLKKWKCSSTCQTKFRPLAPQDSSARIFKGGVQSYVIGTIIQCWLKSDQMGHERTKKESECVLSQDSDQPGH